MNDKELMMRAIRLSEESVKNGGGPFGAVIAKDGEVVAEGPYGYCRAIALLYLGESRLHLHGSGCHRRKQQRYDKSCSHYS